MLGILALLSVITFPIGIVLLFFKAGRAILQVVFTSKFGLFIIIVLCFPAINWCCNLVGLDSEDVAEWLILAPLFLIKWIFQFLFLLIKIMLGI